MKTRMNDFGRKGWAIVIFVLFIYLFSSTAGDTLNVTAEFLAMHLGMDSGNALLMMFAIGGFLGVPVSLVFGLIVAKFKVKWPTVILFFVYAVIWLVNGLATSFALCAAMLILLSAISNAVNLISTQQIMNNWFPKKKGIALGISTAGMPLSGAVMVFVFQRMILGTGISAPYYLMFAVCIVLALLTAFWFKNYPEEAGAFPDNEPISDAQIAKNLEELDSYRSPFTVGRLFRTKQFWQIVVIFSFLFIGLIGLLQQMVPRLMAVGLDQTQSIGWLTIASIVGIPMSYVWGLIDQKVGTKPAVRTFALLWTIMMILSAVGSGLASLPISVVSVVFLSCMHGGMANLMPSMIIQVFGRFDFVAANKLVVPFVVGIRMSSLLIIPVMLGMAGLGNETIGFRNVFLIFAVLAVIAFATACAIKTDCIGKVAEE
jgi:MFS family permease